MLYNTYIPLVMRETTEEIEMSDRTLGCDTSHWSGSINFDKMYNAGAKFWITKATDAYKVNPIQYEDSKFMEFSKGAFAHGKILTGCYHWLQASIDPKTAADYYLERYNRFFFDFPPILDFEETYVIETGKYSDFAWRAQVWLGYVKEKTGRTPIIYTAKWCVYPNTLACNMDFSKRCLNTMYNQQHVKDNLSSMIYIQV